MVALPLKTVHVPVPTVGVLAAIVKTALLHWVILDPALAVVGAVETSTVAEEEVAALQVLPVELTITL